MFSERLKAEIAPQQPLVMFAKSPVVSLKTALGRGSQIVSIAVLIWGALKISFKNTVKVSVV